MNFPGSTSTWLFKVSIWQKTFVLEIHWRKNVLCFATPCRSTFSSTDRPKKPDAPSAWTRRLAIAAGEKSSDAEHKREMECHVVSPFWAEYDRWQRLRARGREDFLALEMARWQSLALLWHSVHTRESLWGNSRNPAMQFQGTYLVHEYLSILQSTITARRQKKEKEGNKAKGEEGSAFACIKHDLTGLHIYPSNLNANSTCQRKCKFLPI